MTTCLCDHTQDEHAFPGALGTRCAHRFCNCMRYRPAPAEPAASGETETPAQIIRRAVDQLRNPIFCGDRATPAVADWLAGEAENARSAFQQPNGEWEMPRFGSVSAALKVARAYLGEESA